MLISRVNRKLRFDRPDLPLSRIEQDWYGKPLDVPAVFGLAVDPESLWFLAARERAPKVHPDAGPGDFCPGLWQYDVAEFFLAHPDSGHYLEFNLAPHGAWWSAEFTSPRVRAHEDDIEIPDVQTYSEISPNGGWRAAAAIPLIGLQTRLGFGAGSRMNVTFIVDSPEQKFLTAHPPVEGEPDFHRLDLFATVEFRPDLSL